ncbi:MAG: response regulator [Mariprofundus sp.]|nr:response regulator [Mariprofundus sp.]
MSDKSEVQPLKRLLLVDDDHAVRMTLGKVMRLKGFSVTYAIQGEEALALFDQLDGQFELIITDICMPEMNGDELMREIRQRNKAIPMIAITGYAEPKLLSKVSSYDALLFDKPLNLEAMMAYIDSIFPPMSPCAAYK